MTLKPLLALVLTCIAAVGDEAAAPSPERQKQLADLKEKPLSLSCSARWWMGVYWNFGPTVLAQKSGDKEVTVSWAGELEKEQAPTVSRTLSPAEGDELRTKLLGLFQKGLQEAASLQEPTDQEVAEHVAKTGHTIPFIELELSVGGLDLKAETMRTKLKLPDAKDLKSIDVKALERLAYSEFLLLGEELEPKPSGEQTAPADGDKPSK